MNRELIKKLHKEITIEAFEKGCIKFLSQISIIKTSFQKDYELNNQYVSILTDIFDPYVFFFSEKEIDKIYTDINDSLDGIIISKIGSDLYEKFLSDKNYDKIEALFAILKKINFTRPVTEIYLKELSKLNINSFRANKLLKSSDWNQLRRIESNYKLDSKRRKKINEWNFGSVIETYLLHRDERIYANYFFNIDNDENLYAVLFYTDIESNKKNIGKIISNILKKYNDINNNLDVIFNLIQDLIKKQQKSDDEIIIDNKKDKLKADIKKITKKLREQQTINKDIPNYESQISILLEKLLLIENDIDNYDADKIKKANGLISEIYNKLDDNKLTLNELKILNRE